MIFKNAPTAFHRIVLTVIRRVVRQAHGKIGLTYKLHDPLHELGAPAVIFRAIVQVDNQRRDIGKAMSDGMPPLR